jgi:hypothetical protein
VLRGDHRELPHPPGFSVERTRPHGHVAAVLGTLRPLHLEPLLPPPSAVHNATRVLAVVVAHRLGAL